MTLREVVERVHNPVPARQLLHPVGISVKLLQDALHRCDLLVERGIDHALNPGTQFLEDPLGRIEFRGIRWLLDQRQPHRSHRGIAVARRPIPHQGGQVRLGLRRLDQ